MQGMSSPLWTTTTKMPLSEATCTELESTGAFCCAPIRRECKSFCCWPSSKMTRLCKAAWNIRGSREEKKTRTCWGDIISRSDHENPARLSEAQITSLSKTRRESISTNIADLYGSAVLSSHRYAGWNRRRLSCAWNNSNCPSKPDLPTARHTSLGRGRLKSNREKKIKWQQQTYTLIFEIILLWRKNEMRVHSQKHRICHASILRWMLLNILERNTKKSKGHLQTHLIELVITAGCGDAVKVKGETENSSRWLRVIVKVFDHCLQQADVIASKQHENKRAHSLDVVFFSITLRPPGGILNKRSLNAIPPKHSPANMRFWNSFLLVNESPAKRESGKSKSVVFASVFDRWN